MPCLKRFVLGVYATICPIYIYFFFLIAPIIFVNSPLCLFRISATFREAVYCTAIREGGMEEWDFAWNQYENVANNAHEKTRLR